MKLKHILAGVLTAAMVITSVPVAGLNASAAETTVISAPTLSMSTAPAKGGQASDSQIIVTHEQVDAGVKTGVSSEKTEYAVNGTNKFLMKFKMKLNSTTNLGTVDDGMLNVFSNYVGNGEGWQMNMNKTRLQIWCQGKKCDNQGQVTTTICWPQTDYVFGAVNNASSGNNLALTDFVGKWHDIVAGYNGKRFILYVDDKKGEVPAVRDYDFALMDGATQTISFGDNNLDAVITDVTMYVGDEVPDLDGANTVAAVNTLLAAKNATGKPLDGTGQFVVDPETVWTQNGSAVTNFISGDYAGTVKLHAKDGFIFSNASVPTSITIGESSQPVTTTVSEDGKTATVTVSYTVENDVASTALEIKGGTPCANSWYVTTGNSGDGGASWAFDKDENGLANTATHWHSNWGDPTDGNIDGHVSENRPIYIQAGFEGAKNVIMISYRPRQDQDNAVNVIGNYEVLAADSTELQPDEEEFVSVCKGTFDPIKDEQNIRLPHAVKATHIRIQATSSIPEANSFVTASHIDMYEKANVQESDVKNIVSLEGKAGVTDTNMGTVTVSPKKGLEGVDTQVTLTATPKDGYHLVRWEVAEGETAPKGLNVQVTLNSTDSKTYTAVFEEGAEPYYKESDYWDKEEAGKTISAQDGGDIWHYQIKNANGWRDIEPQYYYPASPDNENFGRWLQNGDGQNDSFHYGKISKEQLTTNFGTTGYEAVGYAWKAGAKGYYSATLESAVGDGNGVALHVSHVSKDALTANGEELYTGTMSQGSTIDNCRIAKAEVGDYIRIYGTEANTWVTGFKPMIVEKTARDYATQCIADAEELLGEAYSDKRKKAVSDAKDALQTAVDDENKSDADIEKKITALEETMANIEIPVIDGTSVELGGKIGVNFHTNATGGVQVKFTKSGDTSLVNDDQSTVDEDGRKVFTYEVAAKEMADVITAELLDGNGNVIDTVEQSVVQYAKTILDNSAKYPNEQALVKAMLNYGAAAQVQFKHNTDNPANNALGADEKNVEAIGSKLDACETQKMTAESYKGFSLVLESETALKLYFDGTGSPDITVQKADGSENVAVVSGTETKNNFAYVKVPNIAANHLSDVYKVTVNGENAGTVSALTYCYKVAKGNYGASLTNLVNALYAYNQAAVNYVPSSSQD